MDFVRQIARKLKSVFGTTATEIDPKFEAGQVWKFRARLKDPEAVVVIGRVEKLARKDQKKPQGDEVELETVISVMVKGLSIKAPAPRGETLEEISHLPLDRLAMEASVTELVRKGERLPASFEEGYRNWKRAYEQGAASWYKYPVAQCVELAERTFAAETAPRALSPDQSGNRKE